jgi:hypothetical protein
VVPLAVVAGHRALLSVLCAIVVVACALISLRLASEIFWAVATCEADSTMVCWGYCCCSGLLVGLGNSWCCLLAVTCKP